MTVTPPAAFAVATPHADVDRLADVVTSGANTIADH